MENVNIIKTNNKTIYLLGTAHVSSDSAKQAEELIKEVKPQSVCIELDEERLNNMLNPKKWSETDLADVFKQKKASFLLANLILSSYQKRLGDKFNVSVGQEMVYSIKAAKEVDAQIVTIDRSIKTTFMRVWRKMSFMGKMKLLFNLIFSFLDDEGITEEDLEELKQQDMLENALSELAGEFSELKTYLVDERDEFLANGIRNAPGETVVAVVGAAHTIGIKDLIEKDIPKERIDEINTTPPAGKAGKIISWAIPLLIVGMFVTTFIKAPDVLPQQLIKWVVHNGTLSAIGTIIAGGHILSALTAFVVAPITSLDPIMAAGWFSGYVQAKISKPTVADVEKVSEDLTSFSGFRKNKLTKVLLVIVLGNLGSAIGTFTAGLGIFTSFWEVLGL